MTYQSICIVSAQRTGSNYLMSLVDQSAYANLGEVFRRHGEPEEFGPVFALSEEVRALRFTDPATFVDRYVVGSPQWQRPTLWKLQYQSIFSEDGAAWRSQLAEHLQRRQDVYVVLLTRDNLVERFVSQQMAKETGRWMAFTPDEVQHSPRIRIRPRLLLANIERVQAQAERARRLFHRERLVEVTYEELAADPERVRTKIAEQLQLPIPFQPPTFLKQGRELHQSVDNLDELRSYLEGTPWARFVGG